MGDREISEYGEVFDLSLQLICINSSSTYFFKVYREGHEVYYNDDKGDVKDNSLKMIKKLSFDKKEKYCKDITNAFNDFVHKEVERKTENQSIHSLFVKNVMNFFKDFLETLNNEISDDFYSNDKNSFSEKESNNFPLNPETQIDNNLQESYNGKTSKELDEKVSNEKDANMDDFINKQESIIISYLKKKSVIDKRMIQSESRTKYIASAKLTEIWRCIIDLIVSKEISYPDRENIGSFIKANIVDEYNKEYKDTALRQAKHRDKKGTL
jgi:hypothetical protein